MNDRDLEPEKCVETGPFIDHASNKRRIIVLLLAYSAVLGVLSCFLPEEDSPVDLAVGLPLLILGIMWCSVDAAERNHRTGILIRFALVLLFLVGFPIYLVQTRGIGAFKALAFTMLLVGAMWMCSLAASFATVYVCNAAGL